MLSVYLAFGVLLIIILSNIGIRVKSPLRRTPGPFYTIFTSLYLVYKEFTHGRRVYIHELHQKYGPVVRLGPNEVSFAGIDALKEIYMSGGSGYDRSNLYTLFKQFGTPTLFSTPPRNEVRELRILLARSNNIQHAYMKRYMADRYANTTIMKPESIIGIYDLAKDFVNKCLMKCKTDGYADIYVRKYLKVIPMLIQ